MKPVKYIRVFEGKSNNAHLIEFDNGKQYIVKFLKENQKRVLINEWIGYCIARYMQLPVPPSRIVEIPHSFLKEMNHTDNIIYTPQQFASLYIPDCKNGHELTNPNVVNTENLAGIILLDYWLHNTDRTRKNILYKEIAPNEQQLFIIDQADLFGSSNWTTQDLLTLSQRLLKSYTHELLSGFIEEEEQFYRNIQVIKAIPSLLLKEILDFAPVEWGLTAEEKENLLHILEFRRESVLTGNIKKFIREKYLPFKNNKE
ncbi:hypothetical protein LCL95_01635 [Bacillus timonensis]|nr:hypothetical protein [Bacillus timonensis]